MPGKTYIPRTTLAAGSNRVNSNFANKLEHNPVVKGMLANIAKLKLEKEDLKNTNQKLVDANNGLLDTLKSNDANLPQEIDVSLNYYHILADNNTVYTYGLSGEITEA